MASDEPRTREHRQVAALLRLQLTGDLLAKVQAEHDQAFQTALRVCSLAQVSRVTGLTRSGVAHHRDKIRKANTHANR